jgi:uncharacterized membrane protein YfcA
MDQQFSAAFQRGDKSDDRARIAQIRIDLLISLVTLGMSAAPRLGFLHALDLANHRVEVLGMLAGGVVAAWVGASFLSRIPKRRIIGVIATLLLGTAALLAVETFVSGIG